MTVGTPHPAEGCDAECSLDHENCDVSAWSSICRGEPSPPHLWHAFPAPNARPSRSPTSTAESSPGGIPLPSNAKLGAEFQRPCCCIIIIPPKGLCPSHLGGRFQGIVLTASGPPCASSASKTRSLSAITSTHPSALLSLQSRRMKPSATLSCSPTAAACP